MFMFLFTVISNFFYYRSFVLPKQRISDFLELSNASSIKYLYLSRRLCSWTTLALFSTILSSCRRLTHLPNTITWLWCIQPLAAAVDTFASTAKHTPVIRKVMEQKSLLSPAWVHSRAALLKTYSPAGLQLTAGKSNSSSVWCTRRWRQSGFNAERVLASKFYANCM